MSRVLTYDPVNGCIVSDHNKIFNLMSIVLIESAVQPDFFLSAQLIKFSPGPSHDFLWPVDQVHVLFVHETAPLTHIRPRPTSNKDQASLILTGYPLKDLRPCEKSI